MSESPSRPRRSLLLPGVAIGCLLAGGAIGFALHDRLGEGAGRRTPRELRDDGYRFISPLLECDSDREELRNRELKPFQDDVQAHLQELSRAGGIKDVSVYFRELNDGIWFAIGDERSYSPASMRKVPMMIAILKQAERSPALLSQGVVATLRQDHDARQNVRPSQPLELGRTYTVGELITRMIVHSDNNAFMLLSGIVDPRELWKVYALLGMRSPSATGDENPFTLLTYASFFRILYNGTYLTRDLSDQALEQLAQVEFRDGIVAGVPKDVTVAHKFGERSDDATGEKQLHDCGIVYAPRHPYLLCVMTRGAAFEPLIRAIASLSRVVYDEVERQHQRAH